MSRRDELIELCCQEPEKMADLLLAMEGRIAELERRTKRTSQNSDQPPSSDGLSKPPRKQSRSKRKVGGQKGRKGKTLKFSDEPDEIIEHSASDCQRCGTNLGNVKGAMLSRRQEIEIPQDPIKVIEHQRMEKRCPCCSERNAGQWPDYLTGNVQYGRRFKALCAYLLIYQLLPYKRTSELLETLFGYHPGGGTLKRIVDQANDALEPIEQAIREAARASPISHSDETSIRVDGKTVWLHVFSTLRYTYYYWSKYRGQKAHHADGLLPSYEGIVMHDAYPSYFVHDFDHALCNAHLLRELQALYEAEPSQRWAWQLMRLLRVAWSLVKAAKADGLSQLPKSQQDRILALFQQITTRADQQTPRNQRQPKQRGRVAQSTARNLLDRIIDYQPAYLRFVTDFQIPFDNNLAERDLRMSKLQQKISGCFRTSQGADAFCRIRGYISSLRKQGFPLLPALLSLWSLQPFNPTSAE